jgi:hypothetical protein
MVVEVTARELAEVKEEMIWLLTNAIFNGAQDKEEWGRNKINVRS